MATPNLNQALLQSILQLNNQNSIQNPVLNQGIKRAIGIYGPAFAVADPYITATRVAPSEYVPMNLPDHSPAWNAEQNFVEQQAEKAGLPSFSSEIDSPARLRLIDAIGRVQEAGQPIPHFIGTPTEPMGDRAATMDMGSIINGLKILQNQAIQSGDTQALDKILKERAYWENEAKQGMTAEEWMAQTGEPDLVYPKQ